MKKTYTAPRLEKRELLRAVTAVKKELSEPPRDPV
jgi:hypothetical protein